MSAHTIALPAGLEASIALDYGHETVTASGLLFDHDARILSETLPTHYQGYCTPCILADMTAHLLRLADSHDRTTAGEVSETVGLECLC